LRYSELMATDPDKVNAAFFDELHKYYSDDEIVERPIIDTGRVGTTLRRDTDVLGFD